MKTVSCNFFVLIVGAIALIACNDAGITQQQNDSSLTGSLLFTISKSNAPAEVYWVIAELEHPEYATIKDSVNISTPPDSAQLHIKFIQPGTWSLVVSAKDSLGIVRYRGEKSVVIERGVVTVASLSLDPLFGGLEITVTWPYPTGTWKLYPGNPVVKNTLGGWDQDHFYVASPSVLKIGQEYKMWYSSGQNPTINAGKDTLWIALATSTDGVSWIKHGPVMGPGIGGSWTSKGVVAPTVLYENGIYKMWFEGTTGSGNHTGIGYAISADGINWVASPQPILVATTSKPTVWGPAIVKKEGVYYLFYSVRYLISGVYQHEIWLATSQDGLSWIDRGLVLKGRGNVSWETAGVFQPSVLFEGGKLVMFYSAEAQGKGYIGRAESFDGIIWTYSNDLPQLSPNDTAPWLTSLVAIPSVLRVDGKLQMWFASVGQNPYQWAIGYAEQ